MGGNVCYDPIDSKCKLIGTASGQFGIDIVTNNCLKSIIPSPTLIL